GTIGLITYLRTDSTRISEEADQAAKEFISAQYGTQYVAAGDGGKKNSGKIQDAHEAIRPTNIALTPVKVKESLPRDLFRLYQLIWKRFAASRMTAAVYETTNVKILAGGNSFTMSASRLKFDGFMSVYTEADDKDEKNQILTNLEVGQELELADLVSAQHFTQPPAHYTEASLVKALEEQGIGRPSTYAPTITTILARRYVTKENKNLYVTEIGEVVNKIMKERFPSIVDLTFTANLEYLLDRVGDGTMQWKTVVRNFYPDLIEAVNEAKENLETTRIADEVTDEICELCGRNMVIKYGPHGKFLACPGFPDCKNTKPYLEKIGIPCPKCGKDVVIKKTKKGRKFFGCEANPECDFMAWQKPSIEKCPECGGYMLEKGNKLACADAQCGFVKNKK
ncbi:MAG: type I DNA topoisomerase, partial [Lachnospiraceae bacterium]|nr:type I DNA topoisomerase [Lachnospiraceae bacterium]